MEGLFAAQSPAALGALVSSDRAYWGELMAIDDLLLLLFGILLFFLFVLLLDTQNISGSSVEE